MKKKSISKLLILILTLLISILPLAGCGKKEAASDNPADNPAVVTIADSTGDWGFPSPYSHYARGPGYIRMSFIFDTLVWKDDKGYVPALAETWEYDPEENAYIFKLQKNASWHDGKPFSAADVAFTMEYVLKHPYSFTDTSMVKKAEVLDDSTVKVYLGRPYAPFIEIVAGTLPILPQHIWKDVENPEKFQDQTALVGSGPFKLADYNKEQGTYLYEANESYYLGAPKFKQIRFVKISGTMAPAALRQKQVDVVSAPPELTGELEKEGFKIIMGSHDWTAKLMINHQKEPMNRKEFRQALACAIDRQAIVDTCQRGYGIAGSPGLLAPDSVWYNDEVKDLYPYDLNRTAELLQGMGYTRGETYWEKNGKPLELELIYSGQGIGVVGSPGEREAEMLRDQLEKAGIKINMRSLESKTVDSLINEWKFDIALSGHGGLGGDPEILNRVILGESFNSSRYQKNEELKKLLTEQLTTTDTQKRLDLVKKALSVYADEIPALPLYYPNWYYAHAPKVSLFFTKQGVGSGIPLPFNKLAFVK